MWVERVTIEGFRGLHGSFEFASGLTVVTGPNEAGKSSLHEALVRLLCGFSRSERRRNRGPSLRERCAPWDGRQYALVGRLRDGGHSYDVSWDFGSHTVQLTDERGRDLSHKVLARGDDVALGVYLFGVGPDDFRQVCCVDQDALLEVHQSPTLGVALQEAVANVAGDVPVESAIERLNDFLRSTVGARIDTLNPSPTGRLKRLERERLDLKGALTASDDARARLVEVSAEAARLRQEHADRLRDRDTLRQRQLLSEERALSTRLEEALRLKALAATRPGGPLLDESAVDTVKLARDRMRTLDDELKSVAREEEAMRSDVERLEAERRDLVPHVDGLQMYSDVDISRQAEVQSAAAALAELPAADEEQIEIPSRDPLLTRYRQERAVLLASAQPPGHPRLRRAAWIALVIVTLGIAHAIRKLIRRWRGPRPGPLAERLAAYGATSLDELDHRCSDEDKSIVRAEARIEARADQQRQAEERRAHLTDSLTQALDALGAPSAPLEQRVAAYLNGCERHTELIETQAALERVRRELAEARRPAEELARLRRERQGVESDLRAAYAAIGVEETSLEDTERAFEVLVRTAERARTQERAADEAESALRSLLSGESLEALTARRDEAHRRHNEHVAVHGTLADEAGDPTQLAEELAVLEESLRTEAGRLGELESEARQLEDAVGEPAALKERIATIEAEEAILTEARDAVALARDVLHESADELSREFSPHLNEALRRNLARITGGRYEEARVDSDLSVKIVVPETGEVVSADDLSRATKDQIFLVQRLEIARLLAPTKGAAPLFLDDPFAHYDESRLRYGLEILAETAAERQVVLFSEDPALGALAQELCAGSALVQLTPPVREPAGASA